MRRVVSEGGIEGVQRHRRVILSTKTDKVGVAKPAIELILIGIHV